MGSFYQCRYHHDVTRSHAQCMPVRCRWVMSPELDDHRCFKRRTLVVPSAKERCSGDGLDKDLGEKPCANVALQSPANHRPPCRLPRSGLAPHSEVESSPQRSERSKHRGIATVEMRSRRLSIAPLLAECTDWDLRAAVVGFSCARRTGAPLAAGTSH